jgi:class 3 adenylate cyclase
VTHRGTGRYTAIATTPSTFIAGDAAGGVWFLDVPAPYRSAVPPHDAPAQQESSGEEAAYISNPERREGTEFPTTVVFVVIQGLKDCSDAPKVPSALRSLNEALRRVQPGAFVLSTIVGAMVIVPDTERWSPDDLFRALDQTSVGFALRVGVTHGTVEVVHDIDDKPNVIGPPINIAARLATSSSNPGILVDESYADFVDDILAASHWLHRSVRAPLSITGKPQDPLFTCFPGPYQFEAKSLPPERDAPLAPRPAVLIAYDLPKFSAGDRAQLVKRFKGLANVFQKLRQSSTMQVGAALLSPGGDGGVLVLEAVGLTDAASIAARLQSLTEIESLGRDEAIAVDIRIGVHYGQVMHYVNARGIERPTGLALFAADEIAGDKAARSLHGIVLTRLVASHTAGGSDERLASEFKRLPKLASGPASGVDRFVKVDPRRARAVEAAQASKPMSAQAPGSAPTPTRVTHPTRVDLLTRLSGILPAQFDVVLFRANVPAAYIPGGSAPQSTRAISVIRYFELRDQIEQLAEILDEVACSR